MELYADEPGVSVKLNYFNKIPFLIYAGYFHAGCRQHIAVAVVELIAVAMPFADDFAVVRFAGYRVGGEPAIIAAKTQSAADIVDVAYLVGHDVDNGVYLL